ncbi:hypothetical protein MJO28_004297 [Puccinia striiformis f. sp. tritici]|uniref:Uncharacterized protein n=3 Tax=Puccinia striiformis TaxID=27350 RepID=A0A0L0VEU8_9BASI|nr:hypothetical protein Pst134EA_007105 [Puccinia striiformis f. sp. tritici]KAI9616286.1 hypothetical protein KEM48_005200 [Puccinia striiformis f. sp. tritici PST-130]KNE97726.1 hypothetical protein PSTG_08946 [Puccinia striiformis f. sp. tritici PST-78]KAH9460038.1 hypothetical protein Pst134EB_008243 [Puccinia striiformis f. sp. tritici]KAH9469828.1 hypothetical protein Pst134EA_007105 [Puccinia striiformis f. sp. tritici]KAI7957202.1 hypothetical protein MJO28_004297 [Puccinia striiformis
MGDIKEIDDPPTGIDGMDDGAHNEQHPEEDTEVNEEDIDEVIEFQEGEVLMEDDENGTDEEMGEPNEQSEPPFDSSITRFTKHEEPVFCLATHPLNPEICASGGADDLGYIWNTSNGQEILKLEGHKDSLSVIEFSRDGQFLATGGVDATIKIWKNLDPKLFSEWEFLMDLEASEEVTWLTWHPKLTVLLAGFSDGQIYMWQIPSGSMRVFAGHDSMTTCGNFTPDGQKILSATDSGMLFIWDPKTGTTHNKINLNEGKFALRRVQQERSGINSLVINQACTICVLGGIANGGVRLVNLKIGTVIAALDEHESHATVEVEMFEPEGLGVPLVISAGTDGTVLIHDAASFKLRNTLRHQDAITTLVIHRATGQITTGSLDKTLSTWDLKTAQQLKVHSGHQDVVHMAKLTSDHKKLLSCSDDGNVLVFEI